MKASAAGGLTIVPSWLFTVIGSSGGGVCLSSSLRLILNQLHLPAEFVERPLRKHPPRHVLIFRVRAFLDDLAVAPIDHPPASVPEIHRSHPSRQTAGIGLLRSCHKCNVTYYVYLVTPPAEAR